MLASASPDFNMTRKPNQKRSCGFELQIILLVALPSSPGLFSEISFHGNGDQWTEGTEGDFFFFRESLHWIIFARAMKEFELVERGGALPPLPR